ncbi:LysR family transcriptional regulator [Niallia nealsonii]|uniref:LysR family transcriptional regulator n=1 Tax=Niallia nealsonii TaxID=115979 RepID=A0A2N0Z1D8_9BACI|nr:LysR family transcriptional regulator [Niallia nealsonii]PKG23313.1 LysR family transcriptional regulator [Niallia nealsonii]
MNIDYIEAFMYAVHFKSIHKAADALFLSQPTVTARIKTLERELGAELFERSGRGIILTEKGRDFIPFAEQIIRTFEQGKKQLKKGSNLEEMVIGANLITSQYFIPFALPLWKKKHPSILFKFISASNEALVDKLLRKEIDVAFLKKDSHQSLEQVQFLDNSIRLVVKPEHSLAGIQKLTVQQLAKEPLVFFECGAFDWNRVHKIFEIAKVEPRIEFQIGHLEVAKSLIKSGNGIGFLPYLCIKEELDKGELVEIDVTHLLHLTQKIYGTYYSSNRPFLWDDIVSSIELFQHDAVLSGKLAD